MVCSSKMSMDELANNTQYPGVTGPISLSEPKTFDVDLSSRLEQAMIPHGVFESEAGLAHRYAF